MSLPRDESEAQSSYRRTTIEALLCVLALRDGVLPPTINYEQPDPECDLDYVPNEARTADVRVALSNAMGLGGHNGCVLVGRVTA